MQPNKTTNILISFRVAKELATESIRGSMTCMLILVLAACATLAQSETGKPDLPNAAAGTLGWYCR